MACVYAKFSGEVGVCIATSGPGAIHLLNGLYDARMDHQPVLAIVGQRAKGLMFAVLGGDVDTKSILVQSTKEMMSGMFAGVRS